MEKIESTATFASEADARTAIESLTDLRQAEGNAIVGGAHDVRTEGGETVVTVSYRLREGTGDREAKSVLAAIREALGGAELTRTEIAMDTERYPDGRTVSANRVVVGEAGLVVQDDDGEFTIPAGTVLETEMKRVRLVDDEGTVHGEQFARRVIDPQGRLVRFPDAATEADPQVTVEKG